MSQKKKLPFWLGIVLGMVLGVLIAIMSIQTKSDNDTHPLARQTISPPTHKHLPVPAPVHQADPAHQSKPVAPAKTILADTATPPPTSQTPSQQEPPNVVPATVPKPAPATPLPAPPLVHNTSPTWPQGEGRLALILDDVGYDIDALQRLLRLSVPLAISVLPDAPQATKAATLAKQAHHIVMLHLPMQPVDPSLQMDDYFLHSGMSKSEMRRVFLHDLKQVPYAEGVNNHMGSKLTQMQQPMHWVMQMIQEKGLFFVDSRTSANSVAADVAAQVGVAWTTRQIFIDHEMKIASMKKAWKRAQSCIQKGYECVVIGHPRPMTVAFLENYLTKADARHIVSIKRLLSTAKQAKAN